jgi:hypothetical protein
VSKNDERVQVKGNAVMYVQWVSDGGAAAALRRKRAAARDIKIIATTSRYRSKNKSEAAKEIDA